MKLLVDYLGGIGDAILDTAYFKLHKQKFPDVHITVLADIVNLQIFETCEYIDETIYKPVNLSPITTPQLIRNKYDKSILVNGQLSWAWYCKKDIHLLQHRGDQFFSNLPIATIDDINLNIFEKLPDDIISDFKFPIVFVAGRIHAPYQQGKYFSKKFWQDIINSFPDITFLQVGRGDNEYDYHFDDTENYVDLKDKLSMQNIFDLLLKSKFFITSDNFLNHASAALKKRGIVFWGASSPLNYGYKHNINIYNPKDCSPCLYNRADSDEDCCQADGIDSISLDEMKESINILIKETKDD